MPVQWRSRAARLLATLSLLASATLYSRDRTAASSRLTVRNAHSMVYDSDHHQILLFGGADASRVWQDTWRWDDAARTWRFVTAVGPGPRTFAALAYDEDNHEVIMFGGNRVLFGTANQSNTFLGDTWRFRNKRWKRIKTPGPGARAEAAIAYDRKRARIVLFGGYRRTGNQTQRFGDTWEWDGRRWTKRATTGPSPRNGAAMSYDSDRNRVVLFGGPGPSNETWEWDGQRWMQLQAGDVTGRFNPAMVYDAARHEIVRFGGWTGTVRADDTWVLRSGMWVLLKVPGPPARNHAAIVNVPDRARTLLFGGHDGDNVFGDTWEWDGTTWVMVASAPSARFVDNGH